MIEDIIFQTNDKTKDQLNIQLSSHFQIFASVHQEPEYQMLKHSPATRARSTEIHVPAYTKDEVEFLIKNELIKYGTNRNEVNESVSVMFSWREVRKHQLWKLPNDIQLCFRWIDFIFNHHKGVDYEQRLFLGGRFFYFHRLSM